MTRVFLADDHPMIRTALDVLLRDTDFQIVGTAATAHGALAEIDRTRPDILLLDLQMPGGSGMEVLRRVRAIGIPLRVVLLTAAIEDSALIEAKSLKPICSIASIRSATAESGSTPNSAIARAS